MPPGIGSPPSPNGPPATSSRHLVEWFPGFLAGGTGISCPQGPAVDDDPVGAWRTSATPCRRSSTTRRRRARRSRNPHIGEVPLPDAIDRFYTADVFMHTWDLARATGQDDALDPDSAPSCSRGWSRSTSCCGRRASTAPRVAGARRRRRADQDARLHRPRPPLTAGSQPAAPSQVTSVVMRPATTRAAPDGSPHLRSWHPHQLAQPARRAAPDRCGPERPRRAPNLGAVDRLDAATWGRRNPSRPRRPTARPGRRSRARHPTSDHPARLYPYSAHL